MATNLNSMNLSRRTALAGGLTGAAGLIAGGAGAAFAASHQDAELLDLGRQFEAAWAQERPLWDASQAASDDDDAKTLYLRAQEFSKRTAEIVHQIEPQNATTLEGLRVKARAALWYFCGDLAEFDDPTNVRLIASILRDLLSEAVSHG